MCIQTSSFSIRHYLTSSAPRFVPLLLCTGSVSQMGKTAQSAKRNSIETHSKNKSDSSATRSSSNSIQRQRNSRQKGARQAPMITTTPTNPVSNRTRSSSDLSDDEPVVAQPSASSVPRKVSPVHEFATKLTSSEYQCKLCSKVVRCSIDTNSNIRRHLALHHGKIELACKSHRSPRVPISSEKKRLLDEAAIECIIADGRPWGDFQRPGMAKFLSIGLNGYTGPSSQTVRRWLSRMYLQKSQSFKDELAQVPAVSITLDLWKSSRSSHFLCITVHWFDSNFHLNGKVLSFRKFKGRHISIRLRRHIKRVLVRYDLLNKIIATTTDNGANVKAAVGQNKVFGIRLHCLAHALNLTIHKGLSLWPKKEPKNKKGDGGFNQDMDGNGSDVSDVSNANVQDYIVESSESVHASESEDEQFDDDDDSSVSSSSDDDVPPPFNLYDIGAVLNKCREIVTIIRKSSILHELAQGIATDSSIKGDLITDMRIRWNSSYRMIKRMLVYQPVLDKLYEQIGDLPGVTKQQKRKLLDAQLLGNDWNLLQVLRRVLERFDEATKILCGQTYPTLSISHAVMFSLFHYLNSRSVDSLENEIKDLLLQSYNQYMIRHGEESDYIKIAALLDPLTHDLLTTEDKRSAESCIVKEIREGLRHDNLSNSVSNSSTTANSATTVCSNENLQCQSSSSSKSVSMMKNFLNKCGVGFSVGNTNATKSLTIEQEIAKLCSIPKDDYQYDVFWQEHAQTLPQLATLARKYLSIPSTSVPSESAFSVSNYILRKNRLSLSSKNIQFSMFLKDKL